MSNFHPLLVDKSLLNLIKYSVAQMVQMVQESGAVVARDVTGC